MYEEGMLLPPTSQQKEERRLPLSSAHLFWWTAESYAVQTGSRRLGEGNVLDSAHEPTMAELIAFMIEHGIPREARVVYGHCGSHQIVLDWSHVEGEGTSL